MSGGVPETTRAAICGAGRLASQLRTTPFSTSDGSDDPNRASLLEALDRFLTDRGEAPAENGADGLRVFRYEGGDLNYEPRDSAPSDWDGNLGDLIGDYIAVESIPAIRSDERSKVVGEAREKVADLKAHTEANASGADDRWGHRMDGALVALDDVLSAVASLEAPDA